MKKNKNSGSDVLKGYMLHTIDCGKLSNWRLKYVTCGLIKKPQAASEMTSNSQKHQATHDKQHTAIRKKKKVVQASTNLFYMQKNV